MSSSEPTYEYVKGKGWIILYSDMTVTFGCGTRAYVYFRKPEKGELFDTFIICGDGWVEPDGKPNKEKVVMRARDSRFKNLRVWPPDDNYGDEWTSCSYFVYIPV